MVVSPCYVLSVFADRTDLGAGQHPFEGTPRPTQGAANAPIFYFRRSHLYPVCLPRIPPLAYIIDEARIGIYGNGYRTTGD